MFKELNKDQQEKLVNYNAERRNEIKLLSERMKEENRVKREELAKQKNIERQKARNRNESLYQEHVKQVLASKEKTVNQIKSQRISYEEVQQYRIAQSHDIVAQYARKQIEKEHETATQLEKGIEKLKQRELEVKRRLDDVERKLQTSPMSPEQTSSPSNHFNFSTLQLIDRSPRSKRSKAFHFNNKNL